MHRIWNKINKAYCVSFVTSVCNIYFIIPKVIVHDFVLLFYKERVAPFYVLYVWWFLVLPHSDVGLHVQCHLNRLHTNIPLLDWIYLSHPYMLSSTFNHIQHLLLIPTLVPTTPPCEPPSQVFAYTIYNGPAWHSSITCDCVSLFV